MLVALLRNFFIRDHSYCHVDFMRRLPKIIADSKNEIWNTVRYQRRIIAMYLEMGRRLSRRLVREAPLCKYSHGIKDELEIVAKNIVNTDSVARTVEPNVVEHNIHPESNSSKKLLGLQIKLGGPQKADLAMKLNHIKGKPSFLNESYLRETSNSQILTHFGVYGLKVRLNYGLASSLPKQTYKLAADYNKTPFLMKKKDHQVSYYE
ncbi:hypothetical protein ROZALSC1DRAFT_26531 [Rozella allomycis CSF55]|uniref:Uncharacterized protein n=1 Tax=Rozella allomycis (strain CSF55) TaxID=988480 RepID=A0A075ARH1_ROZAC|nr:hypothetical protein O9G_005872 [Rozella allomycis CSF55]RKP22060.1 hypothetical protein ROZALSC1DRAFT_26531 [Rozella allomycis CSF55]|eukprot:EPZ31087.1 hypothetical protein O9G_005872 [Rozella allomycis CSF55]